MLGKVGGRDVEVSNGLGAMTSHCAKLLVAWTRNETSRRKFVNGALYTSRVNCIPSALCSGRRKIVRECFLWGTRSRRCYGEARLRPVKIGRGCGRARIVSSAMAEWPLVYKPASACAIAIRNVRFARSGGSTWVAQSRCRGRSTSWG
jgi:hypothetical protein